MEQQIQNSNLFTAEIVEQILGDQATRTAITKESHLWFFHLYFSQYAKYPTADFQKEMFAVTEDETIKKAVIIAFRGSAKSTIMTMSYPIWAILGKLQKKCVLILSQTQQQAKMHFSNIKRELEGNELLRKDLGPFQEESDEWGSYSLVIPKFNAKIIAASSEQSIRGIRHGAHRPDLVICDDVEDLNSVKTRQGRERTFTWLTGEIIPAGDKDTKYIFVGNLLHEDSLLMKLKQKIEEKSLDGIFREYPIMTESDVSLWSGKFTTKESIEAFKGTVGDEKSWQREYMLKIISDEEQVIKPEWIQYYDEIPPIKTSGYRYTAMGVDLAISEKETADCTAIVTARVFGHREDLKVYILPNPINKRMDFPTTLATIKQLHDTVFDVHNWESKIFVEDVGYQKSLIQELTRGNYKAEGVSPQGQDKRSRLNLISFLISTGKVLFPRNTAVELIQQLTYFGVEKHDDLSDAITILLLKVIEHDRPPIQILDRAVWGI